MKIGEVDIKYITFEGQCLECLTINNKLIKIYCDDIELNITDDIRRCYNKKYGGKNDIR